jgi:tetratricopeptide (TPR) repeat protein
VSDGAGEKSSALFYFGGVLSTVFDAVTKAVEAHKKKDFDTALNIYNNLLGHRIYDPYLCHAAGTLFIDMNMNGIAMQLLTRCVETSPENAPWLAEAYTNMGVALRAEAHEMEAAACYRRSLEIEPTNVSVWGNYAGCHVNFGTPEKCVQIAEQGLLLDKNNVHCRHHKALGLLEMGKYESGFRMYEARLELPQFHHRNFAGERWYGKKVSGTLVIHGEQGLGDEVMFCSLVDRAKKLCDRLVIECNYKLIPLFERSFGVKCYGDPEEIKKHETVSAWCPMGSLPFVFGVKSPVKHHGFLKTNPEFDKKYQKREDFRIGVTWRGGLKGTHAHLRNFPIKTWKEFVRPEWYSLQYGDIGSEIEQLGIKDPGWGGDMDEFASLVKSCDLIITVCNTTVHFAGALNKPCWVLVPSKPAWRYGIAGERMLFYPSVRMFRQADGEDWSEVLKRVSAELERFKEKAA